MYPTISYAEGFLYLTVNARYKSDAVQISGMKHMNGDTYRCPATWGAIKQARGIFGAPLVLEGPEVFEWANQQRQRVEYIEYLKTLTEPPEDWAEYLNQLDNENITLTPMQKLDALIMTLQEGGLNASVTGYGKTIVMLGAIKLLWLMGKDPFPVLVVCRSMMRWVWEWEAKRMFGDDFTYEVIFGTPQKRVRQIQNNAHFAFTSYDGLTKHSRLARYAGLHMTEAQKKPKDMNSRYRTVIGDELHKIKDRQAIRTRAMWAVSDEATYRYGATWTPQANDVADLWSEFRFIDPDEWSTWTKVKDRYFLEEFSWHELNNGAKSSRKHRLNPGTEAEFRSIIDPHMLRRTESLNKIERIYHPPLFVELTSKQTTAYRQMAKDMLATLDDWILRAPNAMVRDLRLRQICNGTPIFGPDPSDSERTTITELTMPSCKVDALLEVLEDGDDQYVVFAESRLLLKLCEEQLTKKGISNVLIAGASGPKEERKRQRNMLEFQGGLHRVALVQYQTGSESITLTSARKTLFLEGTYDLVASIQAPGRTDRQSQQASSVEYQTVVVKNSIEERLHEQVFEKGKSAVETLQDKEFWVKALSLD